MGPSDNELIARAQSGEMVAFEQLVSRYERRVLSIANLYSRDSEEAKDIYQEAFLRVYRGLAGFRGDSQFSTWLYRVVTNVCLSYRRKHGKQAHLSLEQDPAGQAALATQAAEGTPETAYRDREIADRVESALATLPEKQRLVFVLRHYRYLKLKEIADLMNCAEGTVKRYLFEATRKLREQLRGAFEL